MFEGLLVTRGQFIGVDEVVNLFPHQGLVELGAQGEVQKIVIGGFKIFAVIFVDKALSDIINNAATAVVMAPIAVGIAGEIGVNPDCFLMAVAIGASCAFLTPIGHQNNALILGPGGYRFGDYWRMGLPLEVLVIAVSVPTILVVWPL